MYNLYRYSVTGIAYQYKTNLTFEQASEWKQYFTLLGKKTKIEEA